MRSLAPSLTVGEVGKLRSTLRMRLYVSEWPAASKGGCSRGAAEIVSELHALHASSDFAGPNATSHGSAVCDACSENSFPYAKTGEKARLAIMHSVKQQPTRLLSGASTVLSPSLAARSQAAAILASSSPSP